MADIVVITTPAGVLCLHPDCTWTHDTSDPDEQLAAWHQHREEAHQ